MADVPRIFVSHSSKDRALTEAVCQLLTPAADGSRWGYDVLVDYADLQPGMAWPRYLHEWMARCHAAVILLTADAVGSPWVLKEATILAWRRSLDESFKLFVVVVPGVRPLLEERAFAPLFLTHIQELGSDEPAAIADAIRAGLGRPATGTTPFETLAGQLADVLQGVGMHTLKRVAEKLSAVPSRKDWAVDERTRYVEAIARHLVCGHLGQFAGVHELIDEFNTTTQETARKLLGFVSTYWIEPEAAAKLPPLFHADPRVAAALNGASVPEFTAKLYMWRAHPSSRLHTVIPIAGGSHDKLVEHVTSEICDHFRKRRPGMTTEKILQELRAGPPRWYAVLPPPLPDQQALDELLAAFPRVNFILWTGEGLPPADTLRRVEWLEPPVDVAREEQERQDNLAAGDVIYNMSA